MAVHQQPRRHFALRLPQWRAGRTANGTEAADATAAATTTSAVGYVLAGVRLITGFVFLWAFLDKTFGFSYATPGNNAWIDGGSPTEGFLGGVAVGPMEDTFHSWAGDAWADWLFMLGLLGIGLALVLGVALRFAAVATTVMMALMWVAEWPPAQHLSDGSPSMSTNPIVDYHVIYAVVAIALAVTYAGNTWGLGRMWEKLPFVRDHRSLL
ncbi:DoxX family membrane protein [Streptomyces sp. WMMC500]|uniref:DoxX family membrane protein n=1 Tax=Streptomyces sp. WMMC500 TaxID=3015154 RepID=UPI00248B48D1|nr:DoxX family membrane protein [Streptomyces sp. WMMC500]WBB61956.1 DoxX family membrane protein [Streptomyces sp. WMMC500]